MSLKYFGFGTSISNSDKGPEKTEMKIIKTKFYIVKQISIPLNSGFQLFYPPLFFKMSSQGLVIIKEGFKKYTLLYLNTTNFVSPL